MVIIMHNFDVQLLPQMNCKAIFSMQPMIVTSKVDIVFLNFVSLNLRRYKQNKDKMRLGKNIET